MSKELIGHILPYVGLIITLVVLVFSVVLIKMKIAVPSDAIGAISTIILSTFVIADVKNINMYFGVVIVMEILIAIAALLDAKFNRIYRHSREYNSKEELFMLVIMVVFVFCMFIVTVPENIVVGGTMLYSGYTTASGLPYWRYRYLFEKRMTKKEVC